MPAVAIDVRNVTVTRGGRTILRDVSWHVPAGASVALLGPNGSGKSTLSRVVMGQMWPSRGEVDVLGRRFGETDLAEVRANIRIVQSTSVVDVDPEESALRVVLTGFFGTVGLYAEVTPSMEAAAAGALARVGMFRQAAQAYRTLSNGERMRCLIARALVVAPKLLLLDEPTAGLDLLAREQVLATVHMLTQSADPPATVMVTHHVEELLPGTSHVLVLDDGAVAASGDPADVVRSDVLSRVYRFPVTVERHGGRYWTHVEATAWERLAPK